jgi:FAD/FMN-containing dehydrogenase
MSAPTPIPLTSLSPLVYIGGKAALNLPSATGTGDWHMEQTFFLPNPKKQRSRSFISGEGCATDTTAILGDDGIYDCTEILDKLGIPHDSAFAYAASHARAIADLALDSVLRDASPDFVVRDGDKQEVYDILTKAHGHLTADQQEHVRWWERKNAISEPTFAELKALKKENQQRHIAKIEAMSPEERKAAMERLKASFLESPIGPRKPYKMVTIKSPKSESLDDQES